MNIVKGLRVRMRNLVGRDERSKDSGGGVGNNPNILDTYMKLSKKKIQKREFTNHRHFCWRGFLLLLFFWGGAG